LDTRIRPACAEAVSMARDSTLRLFAALLLKTSRRRSAVRARPRSSLLIFLSVPDDSSRTMKVALST